MDPYHLIEIEAEREKILFGCSLPRDTYRGGLCRFQEKGTNVMRSLFDACLVDGVSRQNDSPNFYEFLRFGEAWKNYVVTYGGYMKSVSRPDHGIIIEEIHVVAPGESLVFTVEFTVEFTNLFRKADKFVLTNKEAYAWFD